MKKKIMLIALLTFILFFVGCWDYTEYEQMTQIYSLGLDLNTASNEITLTLQYIPISKSLGEKTGETTKGIVYSASGITLVDALTKLQEASPNKLFFGYLQVIIIGEAAARYLMKDIIVFFDRTPSIRNSVGIIIVPGKAEGTIATRDPNSVNSSGKKIRMLLNSSESNGNTHLVTLHDFLQMLTREGIEAVAPRIITTAPIDDPGEALGGSQNGVKFAVENSGNIMASGMAAFKEDKFAGWLNDKETLGLNWILGNKITTYKTSNIDEPSSNDNTKDLPLYADHRKMLYFYITKSGSKVKVKMENNEPVINLEVKVEAALRKYYSDEGDEYITPDIINSMQKKLERSVYSDITAALQKGKDELDSDIFGFGFNFYRQHPREWNKYYGKSWEKIFRDVSVNVNVEAKVNNTGTNIKKLFIK